MLVISGLPFPHDFSVERSVLDKLIAKLFPLLRSFEPLKLADFHYRKGPLPRRFPDIYLRYVWWLPSNIRELVCV